MIENWWKNNFLFENHTCLFFQHFKYLQSGKNETCRVFKDD